MYFYLYIIKIYYIFWFFFSLHYFKQTLDFCSQGVYNYILYFHISLILLSYFFFILTFIYYIFILYKVNVSNPAPFGIVFTFFTLVTGILWGYSIWQTIIFTDIRIIFIFTLFLFYLFDYLFILLNIRYKIYIFIILFLHLFVLKIKINWTSQIHQSNNFYFFFYHLHLVDLLFLFIIFSMCVVYFLYTYIIANILNRFIEVKE